MAYLNISELLPAAGMGFDHADHGSLNARAWQVVALARYDGMGSLSAKPRFGRLRGFLFGSRPDPRLADPRLEALRRVAVYAWHHGFAIPEREAQAFLAAGHSLGQLETVVTWVDARRG